MKHQGYKDEIVWIIGASSGIGSMLARELSARGATLALSARRADALEDLKSNLGDRHRVFVLDAADQAAVHNTAQEIHATFGRIDRVVFLSAVYQPMKMGALDLAVTRQIIDVNLMGAFYVVHAVTPLLSSQKSMAQIALCGSVAGYAGLPNGQPYSATKAAIINLAESLRSEFSGVIDVKLISPGFVRTEMTSKNDFTMPMMIEPELAAKEIADGLLSSRFEIHFPKIFTGFLKILRLAPYPLYFWITRRL